MLIRSLILSGAATILFTVLLRLLGKRSPNLHRFLWLEVVLLGLCVIPLQYDLPLYDAPVAVAEFSRVENANNAIPFSLQGLGEERIREDFEFRSVNSEARSEFAPVIVDESRTALFRSRLVELDWLLLIWLTGITVLIFRRVYQFVRLQYRLRGLDSDAPELWRQTACGLPIQWAWTENLGPALTLSRMGYRLLFPKTLWDELSDSQRAGILAHEISHYRGGDVYLCEFVRLLVILQWLNPFAWYAAWKFDEATEWKCDDAAYAQSKIGPKDLIDTLMNVHDSTESLGIYLPSFARISVVARVARLVETTSNTLEKSTMKKTLILLFGIALLTIGLVQFNLVAKQTADDSRQTAEEMSQPVSSGLQEQPEIEARIKLAISMIEIPDITAARLTDLLDDLGLDLRKLRVENHEQYQLLENRINEAIIKVCDRILLMNPEFKTVCRVLSEKYWAIWYIAYRNGYTNADNTAYEEFIEECQKWNTPERSEIKHILRTARNGVIAIKIKRLEKIEKPTLAQLEPVLDEVIEFLKTEIDPNTSMAASLIFCAEKMQDAKTMTRQQLLAVYDRLIKVLNEEEEPFRWILSRLENQRAIHQMVGQKVESIQYVEGVLITYFDAEVLTSGTKYPLVPRDSEVEINEPFLIACSTAILGVPELGELFRIGEEFSGKNIRSVLYVSDKNGHKSTQFYLAKNAKSLEDKAFSALLFSPDYYINGTNLRPIAEEFSRFEYKPWHKTFLLIGEDKTILEFGTAATIRSGAYDKALKKISADLLVVSVPCPLFVPLVENGRIDPDDIAVMTIAGDYLSNLRESGVDTLIMGCTHYPLLRDVISKVMGSGVSLIDSGEETAKLAAGDLRERGMLSQSGSKGTIKYFVTDSTEGFSTMASRFLESDVSGHVEQVNIGS